MLESVNPELFKFHLSKTSDRILKVAAFVGAITVIAGGYTWYINNIWVPKVEVVSVDFDNAKAEIKYKNKIIDLQGDAVYWINGDWGVRFGSTRKKDANFYYDRIELVKKGMVVEYLKR